MPLGIKGHHTCRQSELLGPCFKTGSWFTRRLRSGSRQQGLPPQGEGLTQGPRRTTAVVTSITESRYRSGSSSALWLLRYEGATETAKMEEALPRWTGDRIKVSQAFNRLQP